MEMANEAAAKAGRSEKAQNPLTSYRRGRPSTYRADSFIDYGSINFTMHNTTENAEFILAKSATPKLAIVEHMILSWKIDNPGVCMRVTGAVETSQDHY